MRKSSKNDCTAFDDGFVIKLKLHTLRAADWADEVLLRGIAPVNEDGLIIIDPEYHEYLFLSANRYGLKVNLVSTEE